MAKCRVLQLILATSLAHAGLAETYEEYVARHKRVQKMLNPMNVPVANVMSDAWDENPEYANPKDRPAPKKGPSVFYIKSSRDGCGQLTYPFGNK